MHNVPLDNLSSKTSTSVKNNASDSYIGGIPSPQSAQILVPSALNVNAPLQVSLPQAAMTSPHSSYSNIGKLLYASYHMLRHKTQVVFLLDIKIVN